MEKTRVGLVSFTDPRAVKGIGRINKENLRYQNELSIFLKNAGFECFEPFKDKCVNSRSLSDKAAAEFLAADVAAMVFGCWKWTDPMLAVGIARKVDRPIMLAGADDEESTPLGCIAAIGAALWEIAPNSNALNHNRVIGDYERIAKWAAGVGALGKLKESSLLLWGGSYCLKMSHLEDDSSKLKSFLVGDILIEDEYFLVDGAERILNKQHARIRKFLKWLKQNKTETTFDGGRARPEVLERQIALYLAARDRLDDLKEEHISGVSVRCQPALSERYGVTGCIIPSLMPFGEDSEGMRTVVPATCEGDIKGLITSVLLQNIKRGTPPGFGDIRHLNVDDKMMLIVSNCGGASAYYAAPGAGTAAAMSKTYFRPQCQGAAGCAVGYMGPSFGKATLARLMRKNGEYKMQYAVGTSVDVDELIIRRLGWGDTWPVSLFDIDLNLADFTSSMGSNHYSFVPGDVSAELGYACAAAGIRMEKI
ncbi:MAG TPA: fucose isomerase [bacterium]|nr:fucose isomerase [bacterium]